jgi:tRNA(Arg) A34 adenosine deaminase TadA
MRSNGLPPMEILSLHADKKLWAQAYRQAGRGTTGTYSSGAVIFDPRSSKMLTRGCSHYNDTSWPMASVHAEIHALSNGRHLNLGGSVCLITSLSCKGTSPYSASPCLACAFALQKRGVSRVLFPEIVNSRWTVRETTPEGLLGNHNLPPLKGYARYLRVAKAAHH